MRRMLISGAAGFLAAAALLSGCREKAAPAVPEPPLVKVVPATAGYMFESASAIASIKAYDEVNLVARVEGFLVKRLFEEGKPVKKGQLLYEIEPEVYAAKVKAAEAELEKAYANQKNADIEYERQKTLDRQDATSKRAFDNAAAGKQEADAAVKGAEANLALAKQDLSYTKIHSPFDGQIGLNTYSVGNLVDQNSGTLATVVKVDPVRVEFVITEFELIKLLRLQKGAEAPKIRVRLFLQDGSEYSQPGEIAFWSNRVNTSTGTFQLQAVFPNPKRELMAGMFVRVNIGPAEPAKSLLVPLIALMADQAGNYVYVVEPDGRVQRRNLELGYRDRRNVVVESGLRAGDKVIVEGVQKVRPGSPAAPQEDKALLALIPQTPEAALKQETPKGIVQDVPSPLGNTLAPVGEAIEDENVPAGK
ncbi:MAG: efflux RND transporter periplasmic adaptor subunit [Lentisphaeria bacterium]|nr:efflux RND transporter periplasmic adaptor subunit [Lentisphaeria bacterium]